jgi:hypothetical protein
MEDCPFKAVLSNSIARCPFLSAVSERQGPDFAAAIAVDPTVPAVSRVGLRRPVLEDLEAYSLTLARYAQFYKRTSPIGTARRTLCS